MLVSRLICGFRHWLHGLGLLRQLLLQVGRKGEVGNGLQILYLYFQYRLPCRNKTTYYTCQRQLAAHWFFTNRKIKQISFQFRSFYLFLCTTMRNWLCLGIKHHFLLCRLTSLARLPLGRSASCCGRCSCGCTCCSCCSPPSGCASRTIRSLGRLSRWDWSFVFLRRRRGIEAWKGAKEVNWIGEIVNLGRIWTQRLEKWKCE